MLNAQEKAAAWDKPESQLTPVEAAYLADPTGFDLAQEGEWDIEKLGRTQHQSAWVDVQNKARRLLSQQDVVLFHKRPYDLQQPQGFIEVYGNITGDHGRYDAKIIFTHPKSRAIRSWSCQCTWARYVWDRKPIYKVDADGRRKEVNRKFEGRLCSHVLALWWYSFNLPVEYDDVDPEVMKYYLPEMVDQGKLFDTDVYEIIKVKDKRDKERRISPDRLALLLGVDIGLLNKSIQGALDMATSAKEVVTEMRSLIETILSPNTSQQQKQVAFARWEEILSSPQFQETDTVYNPDTGDWDQRLKPTTEINEIKRDIKDRLISIIEANGELQEIISRMPRREVPNPEFFWADRTRYEELKFQISELEKEIRTRTNSLQELYDNNKSTDMFARLKAEDALNLFEWWAKYDERRAKRYVNIFNKTKDPAVFLEMMNERLYVENQMALEGAGLEMPGKSPEELEEERERIRTRPGLGQQSLFSHTSSYFSVISSDTPINDIVLYIQNEIARGSSPVAYTRKEFWGEQRGGLHAHPDAHPVRVRNDGTFIYSPDDLGYDPATGMMGSQTEERGTYASIPVGSDVVIASINPKERMVMIKFLLDSDPPNHNHIVMWVPMRDIDLV